MYKNTKLRQQKGWSELLNNEIFVKKLDLEVTEVNLTHVYDISRISHVPG